MTLDNAFHRGTVTTSQPIIDASQTWNAGGVTFAGVKIAVTNTASAAASLPFQVLGGAGGVTNLFSVRIDGLVTVGTALTVTTGNLTVSSGVAAVTNTADSNTVTLTSSHASYASATVRLLASRPSSSAFYHLYATSNAVEMAYIRGDGVGLFAGGLTALSLAGTTGDLDINSLAGGVNAVRLNRSGGTGGFVVFAGSTTTENLRITDAGVVTLRAGVSGITTLAITGAFTGVTSITMNGTLSNNSNFTVTSAGAVSGITTLAGAGAVTGFSSAAFSGQLSTSAGNILAGAMATAGTTAPTFCLSNTTAPSQDPVAGGFLYALAGALVWRGSSGSITTLAPA